MYMLRIAGQTAGPNRLKLFLTFFTGPSASKYYKIKCSKHISVETPYSKLSSLFLYENGDNKYFQMKIFLPENHDLFRKIALSSLN